MILTSQMTHDYYLKAQPLLESVKKYWHDRFVLGCIGFDPEGYTGEWFRVEREDIPSYRPDYPKNRPGFVTMQNGDFARYIDCADDEVIICVDADTVMQREMSEEDLDAITGTLNQDFKLIAVFPNNPAQILRQTLANICGESAYQQYRYRDWCYMPEITTSFLIAKKPFYLEIAEKFNKQFDKLTKMTSHHAGTQMLFSAICKEYEVAYAAPKYQCASWYSGFNTTTENGILKVNGETVIFNHTKFNT